MVTVSAGVIYSHGKVLITRRPDHEAMHGLWEFPGGKIEPGESPEACLSRELREELNLEVEILSHLCTVKYATHHGVITVLFYLCKPIEGTPQPIQCAEIRWVPVGDLYHYDLLPADREALPKIISVLSSLNNPSHPQPPQSQSNPP